MAAAPDRTCGESGMAHNSAADPIRVVLIVLSDKAALGQRADACLPLMRAALPSERYRIVQERVISDERAVLESLLCELSDRDESDIILTSGGTGLGPRDITPQATSAIADYEVPGLGEAMRAASFASVPTAMLSRAIAVVRRSTLIVNLPGSPRAVKETLAVIAPVLPHAAALLRGESGEHDASSASDVRR